VQIIQLGGVESEKTGFGPQIGARHVGLGIKEPRPV